MNKNNKITKIEQQILLYFTRFLSYVLEIKQILRNISKRVMYPGCFRNSDLLPFGYFIITSCQHYCWWMKMVVMVVLLQMQMLVAPDHNSK